MKDYKLLEKAWEDRMGKYRLKRPEFKLIEWDGKDETFEKISEIAKIERLGHLQIQTLRFTDGDRGVIVLLGDYFVVYPCGKIDAMGQEFFNRFLEEVMFEMPSMASLFPVDPAAGHAVKEDRIHRQGLGFTPTDGGPDEECDIIGDTQTCGFNEKSAYQEHSELVDKLTIKTKVIAPFDPINIFKKCGLPNCEEMCCFNVNTSIRSIDIFTATQVHDMKYIGFTWCDRIGSWQEPDVFTVDQAMAAEKILGIEITSNINWGKKL